MATSMKNPIERLVVAAFACVLGAGIWAPQVAAQEAGAQAGSRPMRPQTPRAFSRPSERVEARLAYIKTALKISDAQLPQWNKFADAMRKWAGERDKRMQAWQSGRKAGVEHRMPTAIERLELSQKRLAAQQQRLTEMIAVEKPLYAALSPEQQKIADQVLTPRGRGKRNDMRSRWRA
jgi:hypothetical protein